MGTTIRYQIEFFSEWHCGSGLAAGADTDALVVKDKNELPYIPGKTLKGLFREAIEDILSFQSQEEVKEEYDRFIAAFGQFEDKEHICKGSIYFGNAGLSEKEQTTILSNKLQPYLYRRLSSTAIDEDGIAQTGSLRSIQVVVPCTLEADVILEDESIEPLLKDAANYIKRLGQSRNRGLGRCKIHFPKP